MVENFLTTPDSHLVREFRQLLPFSALQTTLPFIPFYLFGPVVIPLFVSFFSSLHAAPVGFLESRNCSAIFPDGRKTRFVLFPGSPGGPRAVTSKWLRQITIPAGLPRSCHCNPFALPGRARNGASILGAVHDARGFARHDAAYPAGRRRHRRCHELSKIRRGERLNQDATRSRCDAQKTFFRGRIVLILRLVPLGAGLVLFRCYRSARFWAFQHDYRATADSPAAWGSGHGRPISLWTVGYNPFAQLDRSGSSRRSLPAGRGRKTKSRSSTGPTLNRPAVCAEIQAYGAFLRESPPLADQTCGNAYSL